MYVWLGDVTQRSFPSHYRRLEVKRWHASHVILNIPPWAGKGKYPYCWKFKVTYSNLAMRPACQTSVGALFTPGFLCRFLQGKGNSFPCIRMGLLYSFPDGFSGTAAKGIGRRIRAWAELDEIKLSMKRKPIHIFNDISCLFRLILMWWRKDWMGISPVIKYLYHIEQYAMPLRSFYPPIILLRLRKLDGVNVMILGFLWDRGSIRLALVVEKNISNIF